MGEKLLKLMNKKILITGGLGFIGSHCIEKWKNENWDIVVIDNLSTNSKLYS